MKKIIPLIILLLFQATIYASKFSDSSLFITLNQQIDNYVVAKDISALDKLYANDFVFSHGSGKVEGKEGWFTSVVK